MTADYEKRWRDAMEALGAETVRSKLAYGVAGPDAGAEIRNICDRPYPYREFVERWLAEKDKAAEVTAQRAARVANWTLIASLVAAFAGVIAAVFTVVQALHR